MSFEFHRLHLKDWVVYSGMNTVNFVNYQPGHNLIVVHGKNGFGKTSLLRALQFVFHGSLNRDEYFGVWHDGAKDGSGTGSIEVCLDFIHDNRVVQITRKAEFKPWGNGFAVSENVELIINGHREEHQVEDKIEQLIPRQCQQFIFFDGAEITRYSHKQHEEGVKKAIELFLGIPAVRNLRDDLAKVVKDLEREQKDILRAQGQNEELLQEIEKLEDEQTGYRERLNDLLEKQKGVDQSLSELNKEEADIQVIEVEREQLSLLYRREADLKERRKEHTEKIEELLSAAPLYMLVGPLRQIVEELSTRQTIPSQRAVLSQRQKLIEELLASEDCICGRPIDNEVRSNLYMEVTRLGHLIEEYEASGNQASISRELVALEGVMRHLSANSFTGQELIDRRASIDIDLEEIQADIKKLDAKLEGHELVEVQELQRQKKSLRTKLDELKDNIRAVQSNLTRVETELGQKKRQADSLMAKTQRGAAISHTVTETRNLYGATSAYVDALVERKRTEIEAITTNIFNEITNKPVEYAGVHVNDDYTLEVYRHDGTFVENEKLSAGEKEVLAYSFITALNLSSPTPAPFVMDTPFGHLDSGHRHGLLQSLPQLPVQVFLLATDRDLPPSERDKIQGSIVQELIIQRKQQEACSYIEEA